VHRVQRGERRVLVTLRAPLPHLFQPADNKSLHSQSSQSIGPRLVQDKQIGKKVLRVWGNIPSTNYLQLPRKKTDSLGLTGRFLYVQVRAVAAERESRETQRESVAAGGMPKHGRTVPSASTHTRGV
jgi:hypothetical protein